MFSRKLLALSLSALILSSVPAFAKMGTESGGGGDASEIRVNEIRSDILQWIKNDGAKSLKLPSVLSYGEYESKMTEILQSQKVVIGFIQKDDPSNIELKVSVDGEPKTCRGFISNKDSRSHILCNISRFESMTESDQYRIIHHEFAGLVNVENNEGAASDYNVSTQITNFLEKSTVLKLAVKQTNNDSVQTKCTITCKTKSSNSTVGSEFNLDNGEDQAMSCVYDSWSKVLVNVNKISANNIAITYSTIVNSFVDKRKLPFSTKTTNGFGNTSIEVNCK